MIDIALNVLAFIFLAAVGLFLLGVAIAFRKRIVIVYKHLTWKPKVGDRCIRGSTVGPVELEIIELKDDGTFRCQYRSGYASWQENQRKERVLYKSW